jgi:hypothetical protein
MKISASQDVVHWEAAAAAVMAAVRFAEQAGKHQGKRRRRGFGRKSGGVSAHARRLPAFHRYRDRQGVHRSRVWTVDERLDGKARIAFPGSS